MSGHVMYSSDGHGLWYRTEWAEQCAEKVYFTGKCQGTKGHKGVHWCYGENGSFHWNDNDDDPKEDGGCGSTPPGHKEYKNPVAMAKQHFLRFKKTTKVTDKAIIAKLEKDKTPEKLASVNRPLDLSKESPAFRKMIEERLSSVFKRKKKS